MFKATLFCKTICILRCLTKNSNAVIELSLGRTVCVELYKDYKELGRIMLRYAGITIAAGLVTEVSGLSVSKSVCSNVLLDLMLLRYLIPGMQN